MKSDLFSGDYQALLFDLDGVLTDTASVHAAAWKQTFDAFLHNWRGSGDTRPFDESVDYNEYVDGKPRYDGVRDFLASRNITLPEGSPDNSPEVDTVQGIGNRKDEIFVRVVQERGVRPYAGSVELLQIARERALRTAVVSSSVHTALVVRMAGLEPFLQARVDGIVASQLGLHGKPAPDTYLEAARRLDVQPAKAVVFEDALAGVEAGRAGGFAAVVGLARHEPAAQLLAHGATVVVAGLSELLANR